MSNMSEKGSDEIEDGIRAKIALVQNLFSQINGEDQAQAISLMQQLMGHIASTCEPKDVASILLGHVTPSVLSISHTPLASTQNAADIASFTTPISIDMAVKQETTAVVKKNTLFHQHQSTSSEQSVLQVADGSIKSGAKTSKQQTHEHKKQVQAVIKKQCIQDSAQSPTLVAVIKGKRGRPKGSRNKNTYKKDVVLANQHSGDDQYEWTESYGHKRKNPNPQKFLSDGDDDANDDMVYSADYEPDSGKSKNEDDYDDKNEDDSDDSGCKDKKKNVSYSCDKCSEFKNVGIAKYIRHMKLHSDALLSCRSCRKLMYSIAELDHHQCLATIPMKLQVPRQHTFREIIKCDICGISLGGKRMYNHHMKIKHGQKRPYSYTFPCKFCSKVFPKKLVLFTHMKIHTPDQYVCLQCGKILDTDDEYKTHVKEHNKQLLNMCLDCDKIFVDPLKFKLHMRLHDARSCPTCGKKFANATLLREHVCRPRASSLIMKYTCTYCGRVFPKPWLLQVHVRLHTGEKPVQCKLCNMHFRTLKALAKHKQTYAHMKRNGQVIKDKQHTCELCGRSYFRKQALQRHQKYHTGIRPHCCPHCDYRCPEANNLKRHIALHFKSSRNFMCEICGAAFHAKKTLEMHNTYKHSDLRSFPCIVCNMPFKAANALRRHMKSHSKEKPFKCFCGAAFNRQYNLRRHMLAVHGSDDTLAPVKRVSVLDAPAIEESAASPPIKKTKTKRSLKSPNIVSQLASVQVPNHIQVIPVPNGSASIKSSNPERTSHILLTPSALMPSQISLAAALPLAPPTYTTATIPFTVQALSCQSQQQLLPSEQPSSTLQQPKYVTVSVSHAQMQNHPQQPPDVAATPMREQHLASALSLPTLQAVSIQNLQSFQFHDLPHLKAQQQLEDRPSAYPHILPHYQQLHQQEQQQKQQEPTLITIPPPHILHPTLTTPEENVASAKTVYTYHQPHDLVNTCSPVQATTAVVSTSAISPTNSHPHTPISPHLLLQEQGSSLPATVTNNVHQHTSLPLTLHIEQSDMALSSERSAPLMLVSPTQAVHAQHSGTLPTYSSHDSMHSSYVDSSGRHIIMLPLSSTLLPPVIEIMPQQQHQSQQIEIEPEHYLLHKAEVEAPVVTENLPYQTTDGLPVMLHHINSNS